MKFRSAPKGKLVFTILRYGAQFVNRIVDTESLRKIEKDGVLGGGDVRG